MLAISSASSKPKELLVLAGPAPLLLTLCSPPESRQVLKVELLAQYWSNSILLHGKSLPFSNVGEAACNAVCRCLEWCPCALPSSAYVSAMQHIK